MSELLQSQPWKANNNGRMYTGHIAVGADAAVNGTGQVNSILQDILGVGTVNTVDYIQETFTGTPASWNSGLNIKAVANFGSAATGVFGAEVLGATLSGNAQNVTLLAGFFGGSRHAGSGTITNAYGVPGTIYNTALGSIGTAYALYGAITNSGGGTITNAYSLYGASAVNTLGTVTNAYGLYLEAQTAGATSNYNIYSVGLASRNYFAGYVETASSGGFYLGTTGSVNNRFLLNTPLATDSTAEQINTPSSTARKALVLQMNSGQTAAAMQIQNNSGTMLAQFGADGKLSINNSGLGSNCLDVYTASAGNIATYQSNGATAGGKLVAYILGNTVAGNVYGFHTSGSTSSGALLNTIQQNDNGNAIFEALVLGTGDAQALFDINGGQAWSIGLDNSDSDSFKISSSSTLGTNDVIKIATTGETSILKSLSLPYVAKTTTYSITASDYTIDCTSGTFTVTLPTAASIAGRIYVIKNTGTGVITIATTSSQTIDGVVGATLSTQYSSLTVQSDGANWILI